MEAGTVTWRKSTTPMYALKWKDKRDVYMLDTFGYPVMWPAPQRHRQEVIEKPASVLEYNMHMPKRSEWT